MDILFEWFGQGLNPEIIIFDIIFIAVGILLGIKIRSTKKIRVLIITCLGVCILSMFAVIMHSFLLIILGVYASGISILVLVGTMLGIGIKKIIKLK